jgi:hypothetical protein
MKKGGNVSTQGVQMRISTQIITTQERKERGKTMLYISEKNKIHFDAVGDFAKKINKYEVGEPANTSSLKYNLDYLNNYAGPEVTLCELSPDGPYGFGFRMGRCYRDWECLSCKHLWALPTSITKHTQNISGEEKVQCPKCDSGTIFSSPVQTRFWFNGGLLYHGAIDGFGSGAAPVFAVTLTPTDGWSIHT